MPAVVGSGVISYLGTVSTGSINITTPATFPDGILDINLYISDAAAQTINYVRVNGADTSVTQSAYADYATAPGHDFTNGHKVAKYHFLGAQPSTTYTITCNFSTAVESSLSAVAIEDVDQSNPIRSAVSGSEILGTGNTTMSLSVPSAVDDLVVDAIESNYDAALTQGAGQTVIVSHTSSDMKGTSHKAGASTVTMEWYTPATFFQDTAMVAVSYQPPQSGGGSADIEVGVESVVLTELAPTVTTTADVDVPIEALAITGYAATITTTANIEVPVDSVAVTENAPEVTIAASIAVPVDSLAVTSYTPTTVTTANIDVPVDTLATTSYAPTTVTTANVSTPVDSIALTGYAPDVAVSGVANIEVPVGELAVSGIAATVVTTAAIEVPVETLNTTSYTPTAIVAWSVEVPVDQLALTSYEPTVEVDDNPNIAVPVASLSVAGSEPSIVLTVDTSIPTLSILWTGDGPTVTTYTVGEVDVPVGSVVVDGFVPGIRAVKTTIKSRIRMRELEMMISDIGDLCIVSGSGTEFYGIFDSQHRLETDNNGQEVVILVNVLTVETTVADTLSTSDIIFLGSDTYRLRQKNRIDDGQITEMIVAKVN